MKEVNGGKNNVLQLYRDKQSLLNVVGFDKIKELQNGEFILKSLRYEYPLLYYKVPNFITKLESGCLSGLKLERVSIGSGVKEVGDGVLSNCRDLEVIEVYNHQKDLIPLLKSGNSAKIIIKGERRQ